MDEEHIKLLHKIANTVRQLSMEGVQKANSGHPGLPMGCAEIGAYLWSSQLRYNPKNPNWLNRDRFVLSAGHGSMWIYSLLHLSGYNLSLDDIKNFRQLHSKTPGHPEYHETEGVEATTGPLGQGVGNAVGMALAMKLLGEKFNSDEFPLFDNKVFVLAGDGCIMEGISSEACSLAGHLRLDNLVLIYDSNNISLDGPLPDCFSEDTKARYRAYGWDVYEIDGHDFEAIAPVFDEIRQSQKRPTIVVAHTIIGKGAPTKAGTNKAHGSPLGPEELAGAKEILGLPDEEFYIPQVVKSFFEQKEKPNQELEDKWNELYAQFALKNPELAAEFETMSKNKLPDDLEEQLKSVEIPTPIATRSASQFVLEKIGDLLPQFYGGSADLSGSDMTMMKEFPIVSPGNFKGRNIKFGVREFGMAAMCNGMSLSGMILPYCGTFLTFSDYMRNALRLAALSHYHSMFQFTHDSIFLGEDGPTHQSVEHYAALRAIPNLHVLRPGDSNETKMCWVAMLRYQGPSAIILCRQKLVNLDETNVSFAEGVGRGGYIVKKEKSKPDFTLFATGSELFLALDVAKSLEMTGKDVRVVSMVCFEIFEEQDDAYKESVVGGDIGKRVSIEAGVEQGWHKYIGLDGIAVCMEGFGLSAPAEQLAQEFGFTVESIMERLL